MNAVVSRLSIFSDMNRISLERPLTSSDSEDSEAEEVSRDQEEDPSKVDFHFLKTGNIL